MMKMATANTSPNQIKLILAFLSVYLIWGSTYLGVRFANETLPPFLLASFRYLVAGLILYIFARAKGSPTPAIRDWKSALVVGLLLVLIGNGGVTWALQFVPSGLTAILVATEPLWIVLLAWLWFGKQSKPTVKVMIGLTIGFIGMIFLIAARGTVIEGNVNLVGVLVVILAAASWAIGSLFVVRHPSQTPPTMRIALQMLAGGILLLLSGTLAGEWTEVHPQMVSAKSFMALLYLTFFGTLIGFSAYSWLVQAVPPALAATYAYVNPVVAVLLGWAFAGEQVSMEMILASGVIIGSVVLITSQKSTHPEAAKPQEELVYDQNEN